MNFNFLIGTGAIVLIVIAVIVLLLLIAFISTLNSLKKLNVRVNEAFSDIDVALEKRYDQLTKLLSTVKGYAKHEAEVLENIVKLRNGSYKDASLQEKMELDSKITQVVDKVSLIREAYPDLKASQNFNTLMLSINDIEEHISAARRNYNANVRNLNERIVTFPTNIVASIGGVKKRDFFEAEEKKKEDVKIEF